jgi:hypothetical protein
MIENLETLKKIIEICRKTGVRSLKDGEFQIELASEALLPESEYQKKKKEKEMKESIPDPIAEAEKVMMWSVSSPEVVQ